MQWIFCPAVETNRQVTPGCFFNTFTITEYLIDADGEYLTGVGHDKLKLSIFKKKVIICMFLFKHADWGLLFINHFKIDVNHL